MNIIYKVKFRFWFNIKKGYLKFLKLRGLNDFRSFKQDLFFVDINQKNLPFGIIEQSNINKTLVQYANQKLFDNYFFIYFYFFLIKKKIIFPIPKEFNYVLNKYKYKVNFFISNTLWKIFCHFSDVCWFKRINFNII